MSSTELSTMPSDAGTWTTEVQISDEELTALALAADADAPLGDDAVSIHERGDLDGLLPGWYMPAAGSRRSTGWRRAVVMLLIVGFVVIAASGFCITYGILEIA